MFVSCGIWCLADISSVSPSSQKKTVLLDSVLCLCIFLNIEQLFFFYVKKQYMSNYIVIIF